MLVNLMVRNKQVYNEIDKWELLPLISVSAVIRNYDALRELISVSKLKGITFKKMYEVLLQNYLFAGYPSAILALKKLKESFPGKKLGKAEDMNLYHFMNKGIQNCRKVYGDKFDKLISNVRNFSPDLAEWLVFEGYGKVLGRKGLSLKERELCIVPVLSALKFNDQLYSHINGAYRAKATIKEIRKVIENISLVGDEDISKFGLVILKKFERDKGMF